MLTRFSFQSGYRCIYNRNLRDHVVSSCSRNRLHDVSQRSRKEGAKRRRRGGLCLDRPTDPVAPYMSQAINSSSVTCTKWLELVHLAILPSDSWSDCRSPSSNPGLAAAGGLAMSESEGTSSFEMGTQIALRQIEIAIGITMGTYI